MRSKYILTIEQWKFNYRILTPGTLNSKLYVCFTESEFKRYVYQARSKMWQMQWIVYDVDDITTDARSSIRFYPRVVYDVKRVVRIDSPESVGWSFQVLELWPLVLENKNKKVYWIIILELYCLVSIPLTTFTSHHVIILKDGDLNLIEWLSITLRV